MLVYYFLQYMLYFQYETWIRYLLRIFPLVSHRGRPLGLIKAAVDKKCWLDADKKQCWGQFCLCCEGLTSSHTPNWMKPAGNMWWLSLNGLLWCSSVWHGASGNWASQVGSISSADPSVLWQYLCLPTPPISRAPETLQKHRRLSWDNTCWSYTSITQRLWLHGGKSQRPQMINGTAGRPIWWMALGDLIDVAGISWEFKSMFFLRRVTGKGRRGHLSISDPETNNCRECVDFVWTLFWNSSRVLSVCKKARQRHLQRYHVFIWSSCRGETEILKRSDI